MHRIASFTEVALLNSKVLNLLYPSECKLSTLYAQSHVLSTLRLLNSQHFISAEIKRPYIFKNLTSVCRVLYTAIVTVTLSPVGALWNGGLSLKHYLASKLADDTNKAQETEKAKAYAQAFFVDFSCFCVGAFCNAVLGGILFFSATMLFKAPGTEAKIAALMVSTVLTSCSALVPYWLLGGLDPKWSLTELLAQKDEKAGLFLALSLREKFGMVDQNGNLFPFSSQDKFETIAQDRKYTFQGASFKEFTSDFCRYEKKVIDLICDLNRLFKKNQLPEIPYSYPFLPLKIINDINPVKAKVKDEQDTASICEIETYLLQLNKIIVFYRMIYDRNRLFSVGERLKKVPEYLSIMNQGYYKNYLNKKLQESTL